MGSVLEVGVYPIPLPKDSASLSSTAKPSHRTAPHRRADQLHERDLRSVCTGGVHVKLVIPAVLDDLPRLTATDAHGSLVYIDRVRYGGTQSSDRRGQGSGNQVKRDDAI